MDEFDFDAAADGGNNGSIRNKNRASSSVASSPQGGSSVTSSIRGSSLGKTKTARLQRKREARIAQIDKSVRFEEEPPPHVDEASTSTICRSPSRSKTRRRRRKMRSPVRSSMSSSNESSVRSSLSSQSTLDHNDKEDVVVKGAGVSVWAVQDAGTHRMLLDDTAYLLSMITSSKTPEESLWELALLLSKADKRRILWSQQKQGEEASALLTSILDLVALLAPANNNDDATNDSDDGDQLLDISDDDNDTEGKKRSSLDPTVGRRRGGRAATKTTVLQRLTLSGYQAMSCIVHYLSLDCTTTNSITADAARKHRLSILQRGPAIRGMSQLLLNLDDLITTTAVDHVPTYEENIQSAKSSIATSETSSVASSSVASSPSKKRDPTSSGRRRRRKKRQRPMLPLESIAESPLGAAAPKERLSFSDTSEPLAKTPDTTTEATTNHKAEKILSKIQWRMASGTCDCKDKDENTSAGPLFVKMVTLQALNRIIQGKEEGEETSCLDEEEDEESRPSQEDDDDEESAAKLEASSPLMVTNRLLLESHALPTISTAMSIALQECGTAQCCKPCNHSVVTAFANLVDGACLLSDDNREELCLNGRLLGSILQVLEGHEKKHPLETILICMRTLTSLTHDNPLAGQQLEQTHDGVSTNGTTVLLQLLHHMVTTTPDKSNGEDDDDAKQQYDIIIFLLNTLSNVTSANVQKVMTTFMVPDNGSENHSSFLQWLSRWIVDETSPFRKDVLEASFGKQQGADTAVNPYLHKDAEEHLVTAGNGFVLLACLIMVPQDSQQTTIIREVILQATAGYTLIKNTLRSFCNLYYYSVGELSLAVVAPVKKLIAQLEAEESQITVRVKGVG